MSNGNLPQDSRALTRIDPIPTSAYYSNLQKFAEFQAALDKAMAANDLGHQQWLARHHELLERAKAGRQAECAFFYSLYWSDIAHKNASGESQGGVSPSQLLAIVRIFCFSCFAYFYSDA
jgi:hypothetical protein